MAEKISQQSAKQGTDKPPVNVVLLVSIGLCVLAGLVFFVFFASGGGDPVGSEVGDRVEQLTPSELPDTEPQVDPSGNAPAAQ